MLGRNTTDPTGRNDPTGAILLRFLKDLARAYPTPRNKGDHD